MGAWQFSTELEFSSLMPQANASGLQDDPAPDPVSSRISMRCAAHVAIPCWFLIAGAFPSWITPELTSVSRRRREADGLKRCFVLTTGLLWQAPPCPRILREIAEFVSVTLRETVQRSITSP